MPEDGRPDWIAIEHRNTREFHRLAAVQGLLLNKNGQVWFNWFDEFEINQPSEVVLNFANLQTEYVASGVAALRPLCNEVIRNMKCAAQGAWVEGRTRAVALCGDAFFDAFIRTRRCAAPI